MKQLNGSAQMTASVTSRFTAVVDYIYEHLHEKLDIATLASIAGLSRFHFHRRFVQQFGLSASQMIRLLRLRQAAWQLAFRSGLRIIDIAVHAGYESQEAFARAFRNCCRQSPTEFRGKPGWAYWQTEFEQIHNIALVKEPRLVQHRSLYNFPETPIALLIHKGMPAEIPLSLAKFIRWRKKNALSPSKSRTFNIFYGNDEKGHARLGIGCTGISAVANNASGVIRSTIPALPCVTADFCEDDATLEAQLGQLIKNLRYVQHPFFPPFMERYHLFPDVPAHKASGRIYLPVIT